MVNTAAGKTTMPRMDCLAVRELKRKCLYTASRYIQAMLEMWCNTEEEETYHGVPSLDSGVGL